MSRQCGLEVDADIGPSFHGRWAVSRRGHDRHSEHTRKRAHCSNGSRPFRAIAWYSLRSIPACRSSTSMTSPLFSLSMTNPLRYPGDMRVIISPWVGPREKREGKGTFSFLALPQVPQKRVMEIAGAEFSIVLASLSKRMESMIKKTNLKTKRLHCEVGKGIHTLTGFHEAYRLVFNGDEPEDVDVIDGKWLSSRFQYKRYFRNTLTYDIPKSVRNSVTIVEWLCSFFHPEQLTWDFETLGREEVRCLTTCSPLFKDSYSVVVEGGLLESECLTSLLDHLRSVRLFSVQSEIPLDFQHRQPFCFPSMQYKDAKWARAEDLCTMDVKNLSLGKTNLDCHDINRFLKAWMESESVQVLYLEIESLSTDIDEDVLLDGLRALEYRRHGQVAKTVISTRKDLDREAQVACFGSKSPGQFTFLAMPEFRLNRKKLWMRKLHLKADLEEEEREVAREIRGLEAVRVEWMTEEGKLHMRTIQELKTKRSDIRQRIGDVRRELETEGVHFLEGKPVFFQK